MLNPKIHKTIATLLLFCVTFTAAYSKENDQDVVVIGGGIGGLVAAYELKKGGRSPQVYESASQLGGRIRTVQNIHGTGLYLDAGAELVNSNHHSLIGLMKELGIQFLSRFAYGEPYDHLYFFGSRVLNKNELNAELFQNYGAALKKLSDVQKAILKSKQSSPALSNGQWSEIELKLDNLSAEQYFHSIGIGGILEDLLRSAIESELGASLDRLSALNVLSWFSVDYDLKKIIFFPNDDEMYSVSGGSQKITDALGAYLKDAVHFNQKLIKIQSTDLKKFQLTFSTESGAFHVVNASHVVIAIPFHNLRQVEIEIPIFPTQIMTTIHGVSYASNSKLTLLFKERAWKKNGHSGSAFMDFGAQIWDSSQLQPGITAGSLTAYLGDNDEIRNIGPGAFAKKILTRLEYAYPGISNTYLGHHFETWPASYSGALKPGELTGLVYDSHPLGNLHWAGEAFGSSKGYMDAAVETGKNAALEIIANSIIPLCNAVTDPRGFWVTKEVY